MPRTRKQDHRGRPRLGADPSRNVTFRLPASLATATTAEIRQAIARCLSLPRPAEVNVSVPVIVRKDIRLPGETKEAFDAWRGPLSIGRAVAWMLTR